LISLGNAGPVIGGGDGHCFDGGVSIDVGVDIDKSGVLEPSEFTPSQHMDICDGADGADGA
jgi:hypothetical protein